MKYIEYLNTNVAIDIRNKKTEAVFNTKEISDGESVEVLEAFRKGMVVKVVNDKIIFLVNEYDKRDDIVKERNQRINQLDPFHSEKYQAKLELTKEEIESIDVYWNELLELPQAFDASENKQDWTFEIEIVSNYDNLNASTIDSESFILHQPGFVK